MSRRNIQRIGVVGNLNKEEVRTNLLQLVPALAAEGIQVFVDQEMATTLGPLQGAEVGITKACEIIAVLGGDGTILNVARRFAEDEIPILGIKAGKLGFLTERMSDDSVHRIKKGRFTIQERMRIAAAVKQGDTVITRLTGLNEVVVHATGFSRIFELRTEVDGKFMREYSGDGVILATATGSTAYSLSAGGPLLAPTMKAILVTPLCPHTMSIRPMVLEADECIKVQVLSHRSEIMVTVDGQEGTQIEDGQHVEVVKSDKVTRLVVPEDYDFFNLLREKL
jgi:NAD+ kinase